jgi:hypothetical protein
MNGEGGELRPMPPRALVVASAIAAMLAPAAVRAAPATPTIFRVGTAVADITPTTPQFLGGYDQMDAGTTTADDPLQVRAFFVARGNSAVAFASVDSQGWFAGYQEGPFGVTDARANAAAQITGLGYDMTQADIVVSSTHSHAAPTLMGIWGKTDPDYLKLVETQTVRALTEAASHARDAELWTGSGFIEQIIAHDVVGTDHYDGWTIDAETPYLWARDPSTHATIGLYVDVPVHPDSYRGSGCGGIMSADTPGVVRAILDRALGGTTVSASGTLGRQETIGPSGCGDAGRREIDRDGRYIANRIFAGLVDATPVTNGVVGGSEQLVATPATNAALLALVYGNANGFSCPGDPLPCTIDRSFLPPYLAGNVIGTYVTSLRVGNELWVSEPGEAFPEVSSTIRQSVIGAHAVHVVGMAQDQLGYYYPPEDYVSTVVYPSDFLTYNIGPLLADANVQASALNATALGFAALPLHPNEGQQEPARFFDPGVQFFPIVPRSAARTVSFTGSANHSAAAELADGNPAGVDPFPSDVAPVVYDFGDGTTATAPGEQFDHTFPGPGSYVVSATTNDGNGTARTYSTRVTIDAAPQARMTIMRGALLGLRAGIAGGDGHVLAAHWTFGNGDTADGLQVSHDALPAGTTVAVTIVDGSGDVATRTQTL